MKRLPKVISAKVFNKRTYAALLTFVLLVSSVATYLSLALPPQAVEAQTSAQNTAIFTGQFIPAYFGAAYDPTEAYKVMAGMTVYVFAYDTWGSIVNNYAHQSQIKADGSIQAAGLPNASHYAVCIPYHQYFRAPQINGGDKIQSAFAYNLQPLSGVTARTQTTNVGFDSANAPNCFTTSTRNVDIKNHLNIFPLVPKSVLSVLIRDTAEGVVGASSDVYNYNQPYEIYAKRISVVNDSQGSPQDLDPNGDGSGYALKGSSILVNGPVIRGRSIRFGSLGTTIFQAFAPRGWYAITYWRNGESSTQISYLDYSESQTLSSPYTGMAFEEAEIDAAAIKAWAKNLNVTSDQLNGTKSWEGGSVWVSQPYTYSLWGVVTKAGSSGVSIPAKGARVSINNNPAQPVDITNGRCILDQSDVTTSLNGIYYFSSGCDQSGIARSNATKKSAELNVDASGVQLVNDQATLDSKVGIPARLGGTDGPSRKDVLLSSSVAGDTEAYIFKDGKPYLNATVELYKNGQPLQSLGRPNQNGLIAFYRNILSSNPRDSFKLVVLPDSRHLSTANLTLEHSLDHLAITSQATGSLVTLQSINIQPNDNTLQTLLANLNFNKLAQLIRPSQVLAAQNQFNDGADGGSYNQAVPLWTKDGGPTALWNVYIDPKNLETISGLTQGALTPENWSIDILELDAETVQPDGQPTPYMFARGINLCGQGPKDDIHTNTSAYGENPNFYSGNSDKGAGADEKIKGFRLACKEDNNGYGLADLFNQIDGDVMNFRLKVRLINNKASKNSATYDDSDGEREDEVAIPTVLETDGQGAPITIAKDGDGFKVINNSGTYIQLKAEYPSCGANAKGGNILSKAWGAISSIANLGETIRGVLCSVTSGIVSGAGYVISFLADRFTKVDPFGSQNYGGITTEYWNMVRNFVNGFVALILIIAGVAIMLRYNPQKFRLQEVLKKLVITVIAVNFSVFIIQFAIDLVNVVAFGCILMDCRVTSEPVAWLVIAR